MNHLPKMLAFAAVLSVMLAACGEKKDAGHVAMKINGEAVTAADLERQLEESGMPPNPASGISGTTMQTIIDKELLRQAAIKENLDKDEHVRASLSAANRMILATAYMHKQIEAIGKPTEAEVSGYFNEHPEFFADRKQYDLQDVIIKGKPANGAEIKAKVAGGMNLKDFLRWLDEKKIPYTSQQISASSDQMREEMAKRFRDIHSGQATTLEDENQMSVLFVNAVQPQPVTLAQASPTIMKRLASKRMGEAMQNKLEQLRDQAKIEYVAPYTANGSAGAGQ
ncbi:MAG TPA: EpsD family peptidyl-prolyl cis-trans isomerase [Thiobacillaceae bacterium]|nr:EpsD family peptidyl-prolyl cis-trans isomerase [Thiobacillaceae bacterium]